MTDVIDDVKRWIHEFECQPPGFNDRYRKDIYEILTRIVEREKRMVELIMEMGIMPEYYSKEEL